MNIKSTAQSAPDWNSILRLEEAIHRVSGFTDLLVRRCVSAIDDEDTSSHQTSVLAGIISLESDAFSELHQSFDEVTAYARHLKTQMRREVPRRRK